jgi:hypothetical protein
MSSPAETETAACWNRSTVATRRFAGTRSRGEHVSERGNCLPEGADKDGAWNTRLQGGRKEQAPPVPPAGRKPFNSHPSGTVRSGTFASKVQPIKVGVMEGGRDHLLLYLPAARNRWKVIAVRHAACSRAGSRCVFFSPSGLANCSESRSIPQQI